MIRQGDAVVYKNKGMFKVHNVGTLDFSHVSRGKEYYTLQSIIDAKERAYVPIDDQTSIRKPMNHSEAMELINRLDKIEILWVQNEKLRERDYRDCIAKNSPEGWIKVLKTLNERTKSRGSATMMDKKYRQMLEHALYSEFSYALGIPIDKVGEFIAEQLQKND